MLLKFKLRLSCIFLFLYLDISLDNFFADSNSKEKITFRPDSLFVLVDLLQEGEFLFQCFAGIGFDNFYYFTQRIPGKNEHIQVNLVQINVNLQIFLVRVISLYFQKFCLQIVLTPFRSIFLRKRVI